MFIRKLALVAGAAAATLLMGCAYGPGDRHREYASIGVGVDYDGFYDDYYGPVSDGYWGSDGGFYYSDGPGHAFRRDDGQHFRHDAADHFHAIHGHHSGATSVPAQGRSSGPEASGPR